MKNIAFLVLTQLALTSAQTCTPTCGNGVIGNGLCPNNLCCSQYGYCDNTPAHCSPLAPKSGCALNPGSGSPAPTCVPNCGNGVIGNGNCPVSGECCSQYGYCGTGAAYCSPKAPTTCTPTSSAGSAKAQYVNTCVSPGMIALTYDDGTYNRQSTISQVLTANQVRGTFFINGENGAPEASILTQGARINATFRAGHEIANHGYGHVNMVTRGNPASEVSSLDNRIRAIIGRKPQFFRPPFGSFNDGTLTMLATVGHKFLVHWNLDTNDWKYNSDPTWDGFKPVRAALSAPGVSSRTNSFIILVHETVIPTATNWTQLIITEGKSKGYRFVKLSECLGVPSAYQP